MKRMYETVVVFDGSLPEETITQEQQNFEEFLKKNGDFQRTDVWGKKNLAYEIKKKKTGFYCLFLFEGDGNVSDDIANLFKLNSRILRHLTVLHEAAPKISPDAIKKTKTVVDEEIEEGV